MTPVSKPGKRTSCRMIVIGGSAGGVEALQMVLAELPSGFHLPIAVVIHLHADADIDLLIARLDRDSALKVVEAEHGEFPEPARVYLAPPNYHLLIEPDGRFALSVDEKVNYSRPAIDVLFSSAADAFQDALVGVLLSGASRDGSNGMLRMRALGGMTIVQDPDTAESSFMPSSAIEIDAAKHVLRPTDIGRRLRKIGAVSRQGVEA